MRIDRMKAVKFAVIIAVCLLLAGIVTSFVYQHYGSSLSSGTYENTVYNSSLGAVILNYTDSTNTSYFSQGNYTSDVINFGISTGFVEIKWGGNGTCPQNMSYIDKFGGYCIDQYEAYQITSTTAGSAPGKTPWVSVNQGNARIACVNVGKRLCSSLEWLGAANMKGKVYNLPTDLSGAPYNCNTGTSAAKLTGNASGCVSAEGVYDMVGNVWEWTNEVVDTQKPSTCSPTSAGNCYINSSGVFSASTANTAKYGSDSVYFLANNQTGMAVRRGGYWSSGASAGPFAVFLDYAPTISSTSFGFRCCSSPS